jgi:hypothetical protein
MKKLNKDNFNDSPYFKIDSFNSFEKKIYPLISLTIAIIYFFIFGKFFGGIQFINSLIPNLII